MTSPSLSAQVLVRRFAAASNRLICGQRFAIVIDEATSPLADALRELLGGLGALVEVCDGVNPRTLEAAAIFDLTGTVSPGTAQSQAVLVSVAPGRDARDCQVFASNGTPLRGPHEEQGAAAVERGAQRIRWATAHMPVTREAITRLAEPAPTTRQNLLAGRRIGLSLVLEPKTAVLALELAKAGAQVSVFGHADEIRPDVAHYLQSCGIPVFGAPDATAAEEAAQAAAFLAQGLEVLLDDGSHLIRMAHDPARAPGALDTMIGAAEETTSGLRPLREMESARTLHIPVVASNDARSKTLFDNAYGTGQSCLTTILDLLDPTFEGIDLTGQEVLVIGYGDVGKGFARLVRACSATVTVAEIDPVRALQARMDGHRVGPTEDLAASAHWIISATGMRHTIDSDIFAAAQSGAVLAVIGGVDQEIALNQACETGARLEPTDARAVDHLVTPDGRRLTILDRGGCINCTAGEGNPIEIMDLSFGVQVAALEYVLTNALSPGLHTLPKAADDAVAAAGLFALTSHVKDPA